MLTKIPKNLHFLRKWDILITRKKVILMQYHTFDEHEKTGSGYKNIFDEQNQETFNFNNGLSSEPRSNDDTPLYAPSPDKQALLKAKESMVESVYNNCRYNLGMDDETASKAAHLAAELCYDKHVKYEAAVTEAINRTSSLANLQKYNEEQSHHR